MALVEVSVVEQRYRAVLEVRFGVAVTKVAARFGVSRQSIHKSCPHQDLGGGWGGGLRDPPRAPEVGPVRIPHELGRTGVAPVPWRMSVYRVLVRHGLIGTAQAAEGQLSAVGAR